MPVIALSLFDQCRTLFYRYPAAISGSNSKTVRSVLLMVPGEDLMFFFLDHCLKPADAPFYSIRRWRGSEFADIDPATTSIPGWATPALTEGIPFPRNGALFGWADAGDITALTTFYSTRQPEHPSPSWTAMTLADSAECRWPPFRDQDFSQAFWDFCTASRLVNLSNVIGQIRGTVYWCATPPSFGTNCCAVARDINIPGGHTLRQGRYAYWRSLHEGRPLPSLEDLLADPGKTDLGPRMRRHAAG